MMSGSRFDSMAAVSRFMVQRMYVEGRATDPANYGAENTAAGHEQIE
jgi:hypothetical protein